MKVYSFFDALTLNTEKTILFQAGLFHALRACRQKGLHLGPSRRTHDPAESGALDGGGCRCKSHCLGLAATLREAESEAGMEDVAGRERIDDLDRKNADTAATAIKIVPSPTMMW